MANFFQFKTILVIFVLFCSANVRANVGDFAPFSVEKGGVCEAPPPDSFRVTSIGSTFVTLAWEPSWPGALHFVELKKLDGNGNWNSEQIIDDVPGDSLLIGGLIPGQSYRVSIATKCSSGEVSTFFSEEDFITLILDLTIAGRTPKNPQPISNINIPYENYEWVGFRVSGEGYSGMFEVVVHGLDGASYASIARVLRTPDKIVAAKGNEYPTINIPQIDQVPFLFEMKRLNEPENDDIGFLFFDIVSEDPIVFSLEPEYDNLLLPWKLNYTFTMLSAHETVINQPIISTVGRNVNKKEFLVSNPCFDNLIINSDYKWLCCMNRSLVWLVGFG